MTNAMWYNMTNMNATNILTFTQGVSSIYVNNMLGMMIIIALGIIAFISMNYYWSDTAVNLSISTFFCAILAMLASAVVLVPWSFAVACGILWILTLAYKLLSS